MKLNEILNTFKHKKVLVTGGTGMIGRQVVELLASVENIIIVSASLDDLKLNDTVNYMKVDLTDYKRCLKIIKGFDYVFHIAGVGASAVTAKERPSSHFVPSLMINTNVLEACRVNGIKNVMFTSTVGAYSNDQFLTEVKYSIASHPLDFASWAKRMAEEQIKAYNKEYGLNYAIVRLCNVYGPGDNFELPHALVVPSLLNKIHNNPNNVKILGNGSEVRNFLYSSDAAEGIIKAMYYFNKYEEKILVSSFVNISSSDETTIKEVIMTLKGFIKFDHKFHPFLSMGTNRRVMDTTIAETIFDFKSSTSLREGLEQTWNWYCKNLDEHKRKKSYF